MRAGGRLGSSKTRLAIAGRCLLRPASCALRPRRRSVAHAASIQNGDGAESAPALAARDGITIPMRLPGSQGLAQG
jgi:hypothetical protein